MRPSACHVGLALSLLVLAVSVRALEVPVLTSVRVEVPPGRDLFEALELIRSDEGLPLHDELVRDHVARLGLLGWVAAVEVAIDEPEPDHFAVLYRLVPRETLREIRIEGNRLIPREDLELAVQSRIGECFDLKAALADAGRINDLYHQAGLPLSGILAADNVRFDAGVLTFAVAEAHFDASTRMKLSAPATETPLTGEALSRAIAQADLDRRIPLEQLRIRLDRTSGAIHID